MEEVSVLPLSICDPPIHSGISDMGLSHGDMKGFCLLYPDGAGSVDNGTMVMGLGGPYGTQSPSDSEPAGSVGPYVAGGPVGPV